MKYPVKKYKKPNSNRYIKKESNYFAQPMYGVLFNKSLNMKIFINPN